METVRWECAACGSLALARVAAGELSLLTKGNRHRRRRPNHQPGRVLSRPLPTSSSHAMMR